MNDAPENPHGAGSSTSERLAADRTFFAADRTTMATYRTSISLIGFGVSLVKAKDIIKGTEAIAQHGSLLGLVGEAFIAVAIVASILTLVLNIRFERRMRTAGFERPTPIALSQMIGAAVIGVALIAAILILIGKQ